MNDWLTEFEAVASLDKAVFAQLQEDMGEDLQEVLEAFLETIEELLLDLKNCFADDNSETISRWAHSIKSSAASIGMMKLSVIAAHLEMTQRKGLTVDVNDLVTRIENEYRQSRTLLDI